MIHELVERADGPHSDFSVVEEKGCAGYRKVLEELTLQATDSSSRSTRRAARTALK
jgi:hypothetical protein